MENVEDTNTKGRVTRSLRKRLLSADSEASSRPGTPVTIKLSSIAETTGSPSRPVRATRRNSVSTPVETPVKIKTEVLDPTTTPARRSTRRRSITILEEDSIPPPKVATQSKIDVLMEEDIDLVTSSQHVESKSNSPLQKGRAGKVGPRSKSRSRMEDSDNETAVITIDSDEENASEKKLPEQLIHKDVIDIIYDSPKKLGKQPKSPKLSRDKNTPEATASPTESVKKAKNGNEESGKADAKKPGQTYDFEKDERTDVAKLNESVEDLTLSPKSDHTPLVKSVSFKDSQEDVLKTSYPKTPARTKIISYFNVDKSKEAGDISVDKPKEPGDKYVDNSKEALDKSVDKSKETGDKSIDKSKEAGDKSVDKSKEAGDKSVDKSKEALNKSVKSKEAGDKSVDKSKEALDKPVKSKEAGDKSIDKSEEAGDKSIEKSKEAGDKSVDKSKTAGDKSVDKSKEALDKSVKSKEAGDKSVDKSKEAGDKSVDKSKEAGDKSVDKSKEALDKSVKSKEAGDKSVDKSKEAGDKSVDKSKEALDKSVKSKEAGDKSVDKSKEALDKPVKSKEAGDKSVDKSKEALDKSVDKSKEALDKLVKSNEAVDKSIDKSKEACDKSADKSNETGDKSVDKSKEAADKSKEAVDKSVDKSKEAGDKSVDKSKEAGNKSVDKSKIALDKSVDKSKKAGDKLVESDQDSASSFRDAKGDLHATEASEGHSDPDHSDDSCKGPSDFQDAINDCAEIMPHGTTPRRTKLLSSIQSSTPFVEKTNKPKAATSKALSNSPESRAEDSSSPDKLLRSGKNYGDLSITPPKTSPRRLKKTADTTTASPNQKALEEEHNLEKTRANTRKPDEKKELNKSTSVGDRKSYTETKSASAEGVDTAVKTTYASSWSQGVTKNKGEGGKIDTIVPEVAPVTDAADKKEHKKNPTVAAKRELSQDDLLDVWERDDEDDDDDEDDEDEDDDVIEKCWFIDDEAMEAASGYRSGDSMTEEERREMEENAIIEEGESISSNDSRSGEEEDSEASDSFIVAGSDEESQLAFTEDECEDGEKDTEPKYFKIYKRIEAPSSDSETEDGNDIPKENNITGTKALDFELTRMIDDSVCEFNGTVDHEETIDELIKSNSDAEDAAANGGATNKGLNSSNESNMNGAKGQSGHESNEPCSQSIQSENDTASCHSLKASSSAEKRKSQSPKELSSSMSVKKALDTSEVNVADPNADDSDHCESPMRLHYTNESECSNESDYTPTEARTLRKDRLNVTVHNFGTDGKSSTSKEKQLERMSLPSDLPRKAKRPREAIATSSSNEETEDDEKEEFDTQFENGANGNSDEEESDTSSSDTETDSAEPLNTRRKPSYYGLSVSVGHVNPKKEYVRPPLHSSYTLGAANEKLRVVSLKHPIVKVSSSSEESGTEDEEEEGNNSAESEDIDNDVTLSSDDEKQLEKLADVKPSGQMYSQQRHRSLALESSSSDADMAMASVKKPNRKSCGQASADFQPSQSFVDDINERKQKGQGAKRKRLSTTIGAEAFGALDTTDHEVGHLHKKSKVGGGKSVLLSSTPRIKSKDEASAPAATKEGVKDVKRILSRCDAILEAANRAKLEEKMRNKNGPSKKRSRKRITKKMITKDVAADPQKEVTENQKDKGKNKQVIQQALKASAKIILNPPGKKRQMPLLTSKSTKNVENRNLPVHVLEAISKSGSTINKKEKVIAKEAYDVKMDTNQKSEKRVKMNVGIVVEEPLTPVRMKSSKIKNIHLPTGTVREEPVTPHKKGCQLGFHESPITPKTIGYKVRQILTAGQDIPPEIVSKSSQKASKRKRVAKEEMRAVQKPKWSQSGVFIEEDVVPVRTISTCGTTQFQISSIAASRKAKKVVGCGPKPLGAANSNAMLFKRNAMNRDQIAKESSHEILQRKERLRVHNYF